MEYIPIFELWTRRQGGTVTLLREKEAIIDAIRRTVKVYEITYTDGRPPYRYMETSNGRLVPGDNS